MEKIFNNKTICFMGDSITYNGKFIYDLRAYFHGKNDKPLIYNRGASGNRSIMLKDIFDGEIKDMNPDYVVVNFGVNDVGIWLYDSFKEVTDEILEERKVRNDEYFRGIRESIEIIKANGITPILSSPFPVNELIIEKEEVETVGDNKEKKDYIGPSFYKRATFRNINGVLRYYAEQLKIIASEMGAIYLPMFETLYPITLEVDGIFTEDGIHYTQTGADYIAKTILENFGYEIAEPIFKKTAENDEIARIELLERRAGCIRRGYPYHPMYGDFTDEQVFEHARELLKSPTDWLRAMAQVTLDYYYKIDKLRATLFEMTKNF